MPLRGDVRFDEEERNDGMGLSGELKGRRRGEVVGSSIRRWKVGCRGRFERVRRRLERRVSSRVSDSR